MYQPPSNQPDPNQSFYSDQTSQFSQQPPPPPAYPQPGQYPQYPPKYQIRPIPPQKKWYKRTGGIILLLILFFPVGLFLMWRYTAWAKKTKWIVTGVIAVFALISSISNSQSSSQSASTAPPIQQTAPPVAIHQVSPARLTATAIATRPIPTPKPTTPKPTVAPTAVPKPTAAPQPTQAPAPTAPPVAVCSGVIDSGTCYSTDPTNGTITSSVPADFCNLVACVSDFATKQNGYVVECNNGVYSHSGGVRGACSRDKGEGPPLYRH